MLKTNVSLNQIVKELADFLSKHIRIDKLILFGSHSYGQPREDSDIDIAVISEDFERMSILEKIDLFARNPVLLPLMILFIRFVIEKQNKFFHANSKRYELIEPPCKDEGTSILQGCSGLHEVGGRPPCA